MNRKEISLLIIILAISLILGLYKIDSSAIWIDEAVYVNHITAESVSKMLKSISADGYPPLYFFLLRFWSKFFGISEFSLRFFSLFFFLLSIFPLYVFTKNFTNKNIALISTFLVYISPFFIYLTNIAKYSTLFFFFSCLSFFFFFEFLEHKDIKYFYLFIFFSILLVYTHYLAFFLIFAQIIIFIVNNKFSKLSIKFIVIFILSTLIFYGPWILIFYRQTSDLLEFIGLQDIYQHLKIFPFLAYPHAFAAFTFGDFFPFNKYLFLIAFYALFFGFLFIKGIINFEAKKRNFIIISLFTPMICNHIMMLCWGWYFSSRYFIGIVPFYFITLSNGLNKLKKGWKIFLLNLILVANIFSFNFYYKNLSMFDDNRTIIRYIALNYQNSDAIIVFPPYISLVFKYYDTYFTGEKLIFDFADNLESNSSYQISENDLKKVTGELTKKGIKRIWVFWGLTVKNRIDEKGVAKSWLDKNFDTVLTKNFKPFPISEPCALLRLYKLK